MEKHADAGTDGTSIGRALILGSVLIAVSAYWVVGVENRIIWEITDFSIFPTVIFVLFLLASLNLILARYFEEILSQALRACNHLHHALYSNLTVWA